MFQPFQVSGATTTYMIIKLSYPYIFGILDCRSSKSALSSSDVCVSGIQGIKRLFGKDVVAKHGPSPPMIHGALYLRIGGREHICVFCWRTMRRRPYVRLLSRSWSWSPTGGGVVGRISRYSSSCQDVRRALLYFKRQQNCMTGCFLTSVEACRL